MAERGTARPGRPAGELAARPWPLDAWSGTARALLGHVGRATGPAERLAAFAAVVRQLLADPVLPPDLRPDGWPGDALRSAYAGYRREPTGEVRSRVGGALTADRARSAVRGAARDASYDRHPWGATGR